MSIIPFITTIVLMAIIVGVITFLVTKSIYTRRGDSSSIDSAQQEALKAEIARLTEEVNERNLRILSLEKDVEHSKSETESVRANLKERLSKTEELHKESLEDLRRQNAEAIRLLRESYEKNLSDTKEANEKSLKQQLEAVRSQITSESEKVLKARQEEFTKKAHESFGTIAEDFNKNLSSMKEAFEANKKAQTDTTAELRVKIDDAVKNLNDQTTNVGKKADNLANALRGQNKMQGCWGETQLNNIFLAEGLVEGRDFDKEETLRDELGIVVHNEDTGKKMRPDFILHYPDNTDIMIDCKVSLNALSDYFEAQTEAERQDAAERNLKAVKAQVENLSKKDYSSYIKKGRKSLGYTVMFVPNVNALVLARQKDAHIISDAFRQNVLITSEETLMPFLRLVRTAWINFEQARNQEKIISAATNMIDRVALFCTNYKAVGDKLNDALSAFNKGDVQLRDTGMSILHAAREVQALGVKLKGKRQLPPFIDEVIVETPAIEGAEDSEAEQDD